MPFYAGAIPDIERIPATRLIEIAWRAEAELIHQEIVKCDACRSVRFLKSQLIYEREKARMELLARGATEAQLNKISDLAHIVAVDNPDQHDFRLEAICFELTEGTSPCDRTKASKPSARTSSTGPSRSTATT